MQTERLRFVCLTQRSIESFEHYDGLFSTSANIHSKRIPSSIGVVDQEVLSLVCLDPEHELSRQSPSTILDCSNGDIRVLSPGAFSKDTLSSVVG